MSDVRVAVLFRRLQPYHLARLRAFGDCHHVEAIEVTSEPPIDQYRAQGASNADRHGISARTLFPGTPANQISRLSLWRSLLAQLDEIDPDVVAVPAWGESDSLICLYWARSRKRHAVTMVDSCERDKPRYAIKEAVKKRIIRLFDAALVGGSPHTEYARALGMPPDRIFDGYDVVDNAHFTSCSDRIRADRERYAKQCGLAADFFLASSRFVPKKNLLVLLAGYDLYRKQLGDEAWSLVILGDGPLRPELEKTIADRELSRHVWLKGMVPYSQLPFYYALASAFIHASIVEQWGLVVNEAMASRLAVLVSRCCGCASDLLHAGINGYTFNPFSDAQIAEAMVLFHNSPNRAEMGERSLEIISEWSPKRFAEGLANATRRALLTPPRRFSFLDRALLLLLTTFRPFPTDAKE